MHCSHFQCFLGTQALANMPAQLWRWPAMDTFTHILTALALVLVGVTLHAWRLGNERRDVALLGAIALACGLGAATAAAV